MFVDTNILIYLSDPNFPQHASARAALTRHQSAAPFVINDIVFAELSPGFASPAALSGWLESLGIVQERSSHVSLFRAATAHLAYRKAGGAKTSPLPDFFIGADAETAGVPLLTNDPARFQTYFPELELIAP